MDNSLKINTEINLKVASSSSNEIYTVSFKIDNCLISLNCNCRAGLLKMICKHRINLLTGDISALVDKTEATAVIDILKKIDRTKITDLYIDLDKVETEIKKLETERKRLKKEIGLKFSNGF